MCHLCFFPCLYRLCCYKYSVTGCFLTQILLPWDLLEGWDSWVVESSIFSCLSTLLISIVAALAHISTNSGGGFFRCFFLFNSRQDRRKIKIKHYCLFPHLFHKLMNIPTSLRHECFNLTCLMAVWYIIFLSGSICLTV